MWSGVEKKNAVANNGHAGSRSCPPRRHGPASRVYGKVTPRRASPNNSPVEIATITSPNKTSGGAEMDAARDQVQRAIEDMRPWHQDHAWQTATRRNEELN